MGLIRKKLSRSWSHKKLMLTNMVGDLIVHEKIRTTLSKGKEVLRILDRVMTKARVGDLHRTRQLVSLLRDKSVVHKLCHDVAKRNEERVSGHGRLFRLGTRRGDGAPLVLLTLSDTTVLDNVVDKEEETSEEIESTENVGEGAVSSGEDEKPTQSFQTKEDVEDLPSENE